MTKRPAKAFKRLRKRGRVRRTRFQRGLRPTGGASHLTKAMWVDQHPEDKGRLFP